ncbi:MAG: hypothetical protein AAFO98_11355 [Pseudomonadota bacterium]
MFENIPDWIEILVGLLGSQIPLMWNKRRLRPRKRQRMRRFHIRLGSWMELKSSRRDDDQS